MGLLIDSVADPPDILINERGNLHAVRMNADEIVVSPDRPGFVRDSWWRRYGVSISRSWKALLLDTNAPLRCDSLGCQISLKGRRIAISKDPRAHEDDCNSADIPLSSVPVRIDCTSPDVVIDRFGLWREGTYAIYLKMGGVRVDTVQQYRGSRPWSP